MRKTRIMARDFVVAMAIQDNEPVLLKDLTRALRWFIKEKELKGILIRLFGGGMVSYQDTAMGHMYFVTNEADPVIRPMRLMFWKGWRKWWMLIRGG